MKSVKNLTPTLHPLEAAMTWSVVADNFVIALWRTVIGKKVVVANHLRRSCRLCDRPHGRQSQHILWPGRDQRFAVPPRSGTRLAQPWTSTLDGPDRPAGMRDASHHRRDPTHSHELGRASHRIYPQTRYRDDIRRADDALEGAESEKIVPAGHNLLSNPATVAEIKRILEKNIHGRQEEKDTARR